jgi:putative endonuclease
LNDDRWLKPVVMSDKHELGIKGEELAQAYLRKLDYEILELNWVYGKNEIDIIARKDDELVIVEVKTRQKNQICEPEASVTKSKQRAIIRATSAYIRWHNVESETRFDVIAIILTPSNHKLKHIIGAFYPTL